MKRLAVFVCTALALLVVAGPRASADASAVTVTATVNGQDVASSSQQNPVRLEPSTPAHIQVHVTNNTSQPVTIARVVLSGRVAGLTFYAFDTSVNLTVAADSTQNLGYFLDLSGLRGQATGLIGGSLTLIDAQGHVVAHQATVTDVRGSLNSVYGFFGLALLLLTILALLDVALAIARHRMPTNRWRRATRMLAPGIGIGLVLVFTLSATRVWVPNPAKWWLAGAIFAVIFFVIGYLTPTPVVDGEEPDGEFDGEGEEESTDGDLLAQVAPSVRQYPAPPTLPPHYSVPPPPGPPDGR